MRISDWSSDVCSSDLACAPRETARPTARGRRAVRPWRNRPNGFAASSGTDLEGVEESMRAVGWVGLINPAFRAVVMLGCWSQPSLPAPTVCARALPRQPDRKNAEEGKSVSERVSGGGRRIIKKKKKN